MFKPKNKMNIDYDGKSTLRDFWRKVGENFEDLISGVAGWSKKHIEAPELDHADGSVTERKLSQGVLDMMKSGGGGGGIYVGSEFPTDMNVRWWVDLEGEDVPDELDAPAYCEYEAVRVAGNINEKLSALKRDGHRYITFGAVTDNHVANKHKWIDKSDKLQEITALQDVLTKASIRHGAYALKYVSDLVGCDFIANLGDNQWENNIDTDNAYTAGEYTRNTLLPAFDVEDGGCFGFHLIGNHDQTNGNVDRQWELIGMHNTFDETGATPERCYGYKDYSDKKVRVICLNTSDYLGTTGGYGMSYEQKAFLMAALDLSEKKDCAEWKILLLSHIPLDFYSTEYDITKDVIGILNAYVSGESVSITVNDAWADIHSDTTSGVLTYDYSGKNDAQLICNIHGHLHNDCYGKLRYTDTGGNSVKTQVTRVCTPNTCFYLAKSTAYKDNGDYEAALIPKIQGTAKDTIATFYVVDMTEQKIYSYAYGAGNDRVIDYTPQEDLEPDEPIVPDEPVVDPNYTNLATDIKADTRLNSSGATAAKPGVWTNESYVLVNENDDTDILRIYCPNGDWSQFSSNGPFIAFYDANQSYITGYYWEKASEYGVDLTNDNHLLTMQLPKQAKNGSAVYVDVKYIRTSGLPGTNYGNVIITINEEIL